MADVQKYSVEPYKSMWLKQGEWVADFKSPLYHTEKIDGGSWDLGLGISSWGIYKYPGLEVIILTATHYIDYDGNLDTLDSPRYEVIGRGKDGLWRRMPTYNFELTDEEIAPLREAAERGLQIAVDFESNGSGRVVAIFIDGKPFPEK